MTAYEKMMQIIDTADMETLDYIINAIENELRKRGLEVPAHE